MIEDILTRAASRDDGKEHSLNYWWPSELGYCVRKSVLRRAGVLANLLDEKTLRIFWLGSAIHKIAQEAVTAEIPGIVIHEAPIKNDYYKVSGSIDTIFMSINDEWEAIEYKSIRSLGFRKNLPLPHHELQVGAYLAFPPNDPFTGEPIELRRAHLVYISKEDAEIREFVIEKTDDLVGRVKAALTELEDAYQEFLTSQTLPDPLPPEAVIKKDGTPDVYLRNGPWGNAGDIKTVPNKKTLYCSYRGTGLCCGDE